MVKLVKANIRKDRSILAMFFLIIMVATALVNMTIFMKGYGNFYDNKIDELNVGDYFNYVDASKEESEEILKDFSWIKEAKYTPIITANSMKISVNGKKEKEIYGFYQKYDENEDYNWVEKDDSIKGDIVYVNLYIAASNNIKLGDEISIDTIHFGKDKYKIAGIYEDYIDGGIYTYESFVINDSKFEEIRARRGENTEQNRIDMVSDGSQDDKHAMRVINDAFIKKGFSPTVWDRSIFRASYISIVDIVAGFIAAIATVIMIVCIIMIIFTINNNIKRDIKNIGALRAVGYTNWQIRKAIALEYSIVGGISVVIATIIAHVVFPTLDKGFLRSIVGIRWRNLYCFGSAMIVVSIVVVIAVIAFLSSGKIKNLHPATALRFGLESNSFKHNYLPLDKRFGNLNVLLALKNMLHNKVQSMIIFLVIIMVSFLTVFTGVLFYNSKVDTTNLQRLIQGDVPHGYVYMDLDNREEVGKNMEAIEKVDGVKEVYGLGMVQGYVGDMKSMVLFSNHMEYVDCEIYKGENVKEDNEVIIGSAVAEYADVGIGDSITIGSGKRMNSYVVVGLCQAVYSQGQRIYMTENGAKKLYDDPKFDTIRIRTKNKTVDYINDCLKKIEDTLGSKCLGTQNYWKYQNSRENEIVYTIGTIIFIFVFVNIFIIFLVIRMLMKTIFIKSEKEFGVKKAIGYTSSQLRLQLSLSLAPVTIVAGILGGILGYFGVNKVFDFVFAGFGVKKADLIVKLSFVPLSLLAVTLLVVSFSYLLSGRMKKISAYKLITE